MKILLILSILFFLFCLKVKVDTSQYSSFWAWLLDFITGIMPYLFTMFCLHLYFQITVKEMDLKYQKETEAQEKHFKLLEDLTSTIKKIQN